MILPLHFWCLSLLGVLTFELHVLSCTRAFSHTAVLTHNGIQLVIFCSYSGEPGQECCYDASGNLLAGSPNGGSANHYAPVDFVTYHMHIQHDLIPNSFCCPRNCMMYYDSRPSDDGSNYRPPPPGKHNVASYSGSELLYAVT